MRPFGPISGASVAGDSDLGWWNEPVKQRPASRKWREKRMAAILQRGTDMAVYVHRIQRLDLTNLNAGKWCGRVKRRSRRTKPICDLLDHL